MDFEHGSEDTKLPGIVIDESGEIKQSETAAKLHDVSGGEITQSKTPAKVIDGSEESKQSETHPILYDHKSGEIKQSEIDAKVSDRSGESKKLETSLKVLDGNGESKQSKTPPQGSDGIEEIKQSETPAKLHDESSETKQLKTPPIVLDGIEESKQSSEVPDENRESKQSETPRKVSDGSGESNQPETLPKVNDGMSSPPLQSKVVEATAKRSHRRAPSESLQEVNDGSGGSKHPSSPAFPSKVAEAATKGGHRRSPSVPKVNHGSGKIKHSASPYKVVEATAKGGHTRNPSDRLLSFTSTSSSGSDTSMDDLFQVDSTRFSNSSQIPPLPNSPYCPRLSNVTPTESPPGIQMMDRYGGYDPYRIPASVFDTNNLSNKEMEWSVASNESLFSLHLGNNSFSRDHVVMMGDLTPTKSPELFGISTPRTPPPVVGRQINRIEEGRESASEEMADENITKNTGLRASAEYHSEGRVPPPIVSSPKAPSLVPSLAPSHRSDGSAISGASAKSFAFPILDKIQKNNVQSYGKSAQQKNQRKKRVVGFLSFLGAAAAASGAVGAFLGVLVIGFVVLVGFVLVLVHVVSVVLDVVFKKCKCHGSDRSPAPYP
ncbi:hypothetical protein ACLB2K_036555 [Fragaria x ananassa]